MSWMDIPVHVRHDLLEWNNETYKPNPMPCGPETVNPLDEPDIDPKQLERLEYLYNWGKFHAGDCPTCGTRVYFGEPTNWDHFQGVRQQDFASYPGEPEKYGEEFVRSQCDSCRCNMVGPKIGYDY